MEQIAEKWNSIKEKIREDFGISDVSYNTWIAPLRLGSVKNDMVTIVIPSDQTLSLNYTSKNFTSCFQFTITEMFNHPYEIKFVLESDQKETIPEEKIKNEVSSNYHYEDTHLNPKYTFDTFVVGSNNKFANSAALAVADNPGKTYNPLYLYGGPGLGKTHLMHSIGHYILQHNPNMKILYVTSEEFTNEVIESIRSGNPASMTKLREKYRTVDVLMVDDVQFIIGKESTQEEFFHTFNNLHAAGKQIILSSDKPPKDIQTLEERLRSRFEWGLTTDIQPPDYETRMAILRKKNAEIYDKAIDEEVIHYIATNIKSNIRELEGALQKFIAYAKFNNKEEFNLSTAEEALKDIIIPKKTKEITPELILNVVCEYFHFKPEDIKSQKRTGELVNARQVYMYLCREMTSCSLSTIGSMIGGRDHTTVMHGVEKIEKKLVENPDFTETIDMLTKKINPVSST